MKYTTHLIMNVTAKYPRIDKPYHFDLKAGPKGKSVPCDAIEDGACYELSFAMVESQAKELYAAMNKAYKDCPARNDSWGAKLTQPFKSDEGFFIGKAKLKASYQGKPTPRPFQFDVDNLELPEDFMLTSGSMVNLAVELVPYKTKLSEGVSLRLRQVQVIEYVPYAAASLFDTQDGFKYNTDTVTEDEAESDDSSLFAATTDTVVEEPEEEEEEVVKEPVKRAKKKDKPEPSKDSDDLASVIDSWGIDE